MCSTPTIFFDYTGRCSAIQSIIWYRVEKVINSTIKLEFSMGFTTLAYFKLLLFLTGYITQSANH